MRIERSFRLAAAPWAVWASLEDSRLMAECLPGAELEGGTDPDNLEGRLTVRLGPIVAGFEGTVTITRDETSRGGTMQAQGIDKRTRTKVRADISYQLAESDGESTVTIACDSCLTGALVLFASKDLVDKVANELIEGFSQRLEQRLAV